MPRTFKAELERKYNGRYDIPSTLLCFRVKAEDIDEATTIVAERLGKVMLNEGDYTIPYCDEIFSEIAFDDADMGMEILYTIVEVG